MSYPPQAIRQDSWPFPQLYNAPNSAMPLPFSQASAAAAAAFIDMNASSVATVAQDVIRAPSANYSLSDRITIENQNKRIADLESKLVRISQQFDTSQGEKRKRSQDETSVSVQSASSSTRAATTTTTTTTASSTSPSAPAAADSRLLTLLVEQSRIQQQIQEQLLQQLLTSQTVAQQTQQPSFTPQNTSQPQIKVSASMNALFKCAQSDDEVGGEEEPAPKRQDRNDEMPVVLAPPQQAVIPEVAAPPQQAVIPEVAAPQQQAVIPEVAAPPQQAVIPEEAAPPPQAVILEVAAPPQHAVIPEEAALQPQAVILEVVAAPQAIIPHEPAEGPVEVPAPFVWRTIQIHDEEVQYKGPTDESGLPHGIGKVKYPDDTIYVGQLVRGVREGKGVLKYPKARTNSPYKKEGTFSQGELDGEVTFTCKGGASKVVLFRNGKKVRRV